MRTLIFASLLIAGCTQEPPPDQRTVTLVFAASTAEVARLCSDAGVLEDFGCAKGSGAMADGRGASCTIVALRPRGFDDAERIRTLGHELWHCFRGPVHT